MKNSNIKIDYPVRINRCLYLMGYCSRRKADIFIKNGLVFINSKKAKLTDRVFAEDKVGVGSRVNNEKNNYIYIAYNKPVGIVSHNPQKGEQDALSQIKLGVKLSPLGRLDKASSGLMIFSNDGRIVDKLLNPIYSHEKEYAVSVDKRISKDFIKKMEQGVKIENYKTKPAKIKKISPRSFNIILTEGKKHQIRRMCAALGYQVQSIKRLRIQNIKLGNLKLGSHKNLDGSELKVFLSQLLN